MPVSRQAALLEVLLGATEPLLHAGPATVAAASVALDHAAGLTNVSLLPLLQLASGSPSGGLFASGVCKWGVTPSEHLMT